MLQALRSSQGAGRPLVVWAALGLGVLALHLALLARWMGGGVLALGQAGPVPVRPLVRPSVQLLARQDFKPLPAAAGDANAALPAPPAATSRLPPAVRRTVLGPSGPMPGLATAPLPQAILDRPGPLAHPDAAAIAAAPAAPAAPEGEAEAAPGDDAAGPVAALSPLRGDPPPLYPAQPPAAATLRYALHYFGRSGQALLHWRPAGAAYSLQLQGLPAAPADSPGAPPMLPGRAGPRAAGRPLIEQASQGQLDAHGLAPDRFTDSRGGRGRRAANFRRDLGQIEFSGPATRLPAWPGAQDRLSWWVQLPAIVAAAASVPAEVRLFVVDARGGGELLRFEFLGWVAAPDAPGPATLQHWQHQPAQPEGQRMELWLDPAQGHWPVLLRLSSLRSGQRFELRLLGID